MKHDPTGFTHWADDGVVRTYCSNGTVVDAVRLDNAYLMAHVDKMLLGVEHKAHMRSVWAGTSGLDVADDQLLNPATHLRPHPDNSGTALQSPNQAESVKEDLLDKRTCLGSMCTSEDWCLDRGCSGCQLYDSLSPQLRICQSIIPNAPPPSPVLGCDFGGLGCWKKVQNTTNATEVA